MLPAFQVGSKNINTKSTKLTFFLFNLLELFLGLGDLRRIIQDSTLTISRLLTNPSTLVDINFVDYFVLDILVFLSGLKKTPGRIGCGS